LFSEEALQITSARKISGSKRGEVTRIFYDVFGKLSS
jgi:hypothetical protein